MNGDKVIIKCHDGREQLFHLFAQVAEKMLRDDEETKTSAGLSKLLQ